MLKEALKVVEAARLLGLMQRNGKTTSPLSQSELARNLEGLRLAIETFDKHSEHGRGTPEDQPKPDFATPPQLDDDGFDTPDYNLTPKFYPGEFADEMRDRFLPEEPELKLKEKQEQRDADEFFEAISKKLIASIAVPANRREARYGQVADYSDISDTLLFDNDESVGDFLLAIDRIDDKLGLYASKQGWNPRLRALAQAMLEMRKRLVLEIKEDGVFLTIPAHVFSGLTATIADAVVDRDMRMHVPEMRAKLRPHNDREQELENRYLPRPRFSDD